MRMNSSTSIGSASLAMGTKKGFQTGRGEATVDGYGGEEIVGFSITQCPSVLRDVLLAEDEKSVCSPSNRTIDEYMIAEELSGKLLFPEQCGGGGGYFVLKALKAVPVDYTRKEVYSSLFGLY